MKKPKKMNGLYKAAFVLMLVCVALLVTAIVVSYAVGNEQIAVLTAIAGAVLCVAAIVLAMFSKPKQPKQPKRRHDISQNELKDAVDNEEIL